MQKEITYKKTGSWISNSNVASFRVWAPFAEQADVIIISSSNKAFPMEKEEKGYWFALVPNCKPGTRYLFRLDGKDPLPDPSSHCQPEGVHKPSELIDLKDFRWEDKQWKPPTLEQLITYELHTGTFSDSGDFDGIAEKLDYLIELGINAIELLPVAQFPGKRNWGYDGVYPYAVQNSYGGAKGLMRLVNECHKKGLAVILDVVYNHLGPEGNYLGQFGPYFTDRYGTPWGQAINYDDAWCDGVRNYVVQNMRMWFKLFHIDALRLDAVHAIYDFSAYHIMKELARVRDEINLETGKTHYLIAESALNDRRYIDPYEKGGYGLDAQWNDDLHHAVHALYTGERNGYYKDYGSAENLATAYTNAFVYEGQYSEFRKRNFGNSAARNEAKQFVVFTQNHDQVGNRKLGERNSVLKSFGMQKVFAATMFLSPYLPMLFMGEEYGEKNPFLYFVDHNDPHLNKLVREGRENEFRSFHEAGEAPTPDPSAIETFINSKLNFELLREKNGKNLLAWYKKLIQHKKNHAVLKQADKNNIETAYLGNLLFIHRWHKTEHVLAIINYGTEDAECKSPIQFPGKLNLLIDSEDQSFGGQFSSNSLNILASSTVRISKESVLIYSSL